MAHYKNRCLKSHNRKYSENLSRNSRQAVLSLEGIDVLGLICYNGTQTGISRLDP